MADSRHGKPLVTKVSIVIMQVRYALFLALSTSVLSYVVSSRCSGDEAQIYRHTCLIKLTRNEHGHIMDSAYVPQSIERRNIHAYPHKFIYILALDKPV